MSSVIYKFISLADCAFRKRLAVCENYSKPLFSQPSSPPKSLWQEQLALILSEMPASKLIQQSRQNSPLKLLPFVYITLYLFNRVYSSLNQGSTRFQLTFHDDTSCKTRSEERRVGKEWSCRW